MFKWLFLLALAYYIYRTLRNLVDASLRGTPDRQQFQRHHQRANERVRSPRQEQSAKTSSRDERRSDVEDAKWTDV